MIVHLMWHIMYINLALESRISWNPENKVLLAETHSEYSLERNTLVAWSDSCGGQNQNIKVTVTNKNKVQSNNNSYKK